MISWFSLSCINVFSTIQHFNQNSQNPASSHFSGGEHQNVRHAIQNERASERGPLSLNGNSTKLNWKPFRRAHTSHVHKDLRVRRLLISHQTQRKIESHMYAHLAHNTRIKTRYRTIARLIIVRRIFYNWEFWTHWVYRPSTKPCEGNQPANR